MKLLISLLIMFFMILIIYQILFINIYTAEGLANNTSGQYQEYSSNNPGILAQQNAGNIKVLEGQVNKLTDLKTEVSDISRNMVTMSTQISNIQQQVSALTSQQQSAADNINKKLPVTGATS